MSKDVPPIKKIIVAIHGVGNQLRSSTIRSVAQQFGDRNQPPLPVMPLGFFNLGSDAEVRVSRLSLDAKSPLSEIGFAEIFWADIPGQVVKANDTLEETKAWGRTVVSRAEAEYRKNVINGNLTRNDFQLGIGVIEELVETVDTLEKLLTVTASAGLFKFELGTLMRDYVGDVQLVTDFPFYRDKIVYRFRAAMSQILKGYREHFPGLDPEIHLVAHSEGTVISLLALLRVLSGQPATDPDKGAAGSAPLDDEWIRYVRGYMTIGSPIDKHIVLWPRLWDDLQLKSEMDLDGRVMLKRSGGNPIAITPIKWRNYYDHGDPIGFQLDTVRALLRSRQCKAFEFEAQHDMGFSRYWLPGKAHNDYWEDGVVFGHFIDDVVVPRKPVSPPASKWWVDKVSLLLPYSLVFVLHVLAIFILYRAVTDASKLEIMRSALPVHVALLSLMLTGITVAARLPRLVKANSLRWLIASMVAFLVGVVPFVCALTSGIADFVGGPLVKLMVFLQVPNDYANKAAITLAALIIASTGWLAPRRPKIGRRLLVGVGMAVVVFVVAARLIAGGLTEPIWPVVLAAGAFMYLWWLAILLFDLTFVWHRYIRRAVAVNTLAHWKVKHEDAAPHTLLGLGPAPASAKAGDLKAATPGG